MEMISFALYCMLFGILVFCPVTDGASLTWNEPAPTQVVQAAVNPVKLFSSRELFQGTINATLSWQFDLAELIYKSSVVFFEDKSVARVSSLVTGTPPSYANRFGLDWDPKQNLLTLFIFNVTTKENGTFSFRVTADSLDGYNAFQFINNVQVDVVGPPSNIVTSSNQTIIAPDELTLNCSADGIPKPIITWTRLSDNTAVTMPLIIIRGKDEEIYKCTANNGVGKPLTKDVHINILFSPKVTLAEKFFVGQGKTASLICQVEGNPKPTISWSPCDLPNVVCDKQYLNISKVQTARANYNCTARNAVGIDSASTLLIIGGYKIFLSVGIIEECDKKSSVWEELKRELINVFEKSMQDFSGIELIVASCRNLIFDMVLTFSTEVGEDDIISIIQNSIVDGKLGGVNVNTSYIIGFSAPFTSTKRAPTRTTSKSDDNTELIIGVVLGSVAFVALVVFIIWSVRKKKCCNSEAKEVSDNADSAQGRKGEGQNGSDEVAPASISTLHHSTRAEEKNDQSTVQALPMYEQLDKTKTTSNKGGAAQSQLPLKGRAHESLLNGQYTTKSDGWSTLCTDGRVENCKLDETRLR